MDMSLGSLLGARPTSAFRPRFDAVGRWLLDLAGPESVAEATVFTNVVPGSTEVVRPWVEALRNVGFAVFAKPKLSEDSDIDDDMLAHIRLRDAEGWLRHVVVASGDGRAFREPLEGLVARDVAVTVIGFREHATFALSSDLLEVRRPRGHRRRVPRAAAPDHPRHPARDRGVAAAVPVAAFAAGAAEMTPVRLRAPVVLPCDPACSVLRDAVVDVDDDGRIAWVGPRSAAPPTEAPVRELSGALLPGLVNTHAHTPMIVLRGAGGDLPLMRWLREVMWPTEGRLRAADVRAGMTAGCVELLRTGCTTTVEMYFYIDAVVDAVPTVGSRVLLTPGIIDAPGWSRLGTWEQMRDDDLGAHRRRRAAVRAGRADRARVRPARRVHAARAGAAHGR